MFCVAVAIDWAECPGCGGTFIFVETEDLEFFTDGSRAECSCGLKGQIHGDAETDAHIEWFL